MSVHGGQTPVRFPENLYRHVSPTSIEGNLCQICPLPSPLLKLANPKRRERPVGCTYSVQRLLTTVIWNQLHMKLFPPALRICFPSSESFLFQNLSFSIAIVLHCFVFSVIVPAR
ncbi:unnamed protein product [Lactuca virosa]|uniref:Uncharacterized protein n=1 Tax=Lactuca virosa TaxID=75947 RepID=A0AAU9PNZ0_9ASTR|nr:unnamed protein product [Lactuca virosa]